MATTRLASLLFGLTAVLSLSTCSPSAPAGMQATKPMSPADGAKDYDQTPPGPAYPEPLETGQSAGGRPGSTEQSTACPPRCGVDGAWRGCGLKSPRGGPCPGCTPTCTHKRMPEEGWYDCAGALIVRAVCP